MSSMVKFLILKPILFKIFSDMSGMIGAKKIAIFAIIITKIFNTSPALSLSSLINCHGALSSTYLLAFEINFQMFSITL